jgi:hypothetical protein
MSKHERLALKMVPLFSVVFIAAFLAANGLAGLDVTLSLLAAGGAVALVAVVIEWRHTERSIETRDEDFQQAVRDLDDALSGRDGP